MSHCLLTVFTPAYNRAYTLSRTYESLCSQECKDFVWLIIDDGSTDNTRDLVQRWQKEDNAFEIRYVHKKNGGMHTAHNTAYSMIDTELNICIDSDDAMAPGAVGTIKTEWEKVRDKGYAGLLGLDAEFSGQIIGEGFPKNMADTTLSGYYQQGGRGDKKLVLRTDIVRNYPPYPEYAGEKFVPLGTLYAMIDQDYRLRVVDDVLCLVEYMPDGSTKNMVRQYYKNPKGFRYSRLVHMKLSQPLKRKVALHVHYVAESILAHEHILKDSPDKLMSLLVFPAGLVLSWHIQSKCR